MTQTHCFTVMDLALTAQAHGRHMLKVAIIGAGIGAEHFAAYRDVAACDVTLIVDQDADRARALSAGSCAVATSIADRAAKRR